MGHLGEGWFPGHALQPYELRAWGSDAGRSEILEACTCDPKNPPRSFVVIFAKAPPASTAIGPAAAGSDSPCVHQ